MAVLDETLRRQYLALLGIEQWLPRGEADPLAGASRPADAVTESPSPVAAEPPSPVAERHPLPAGAREEQPIPLSPPGGEGRGEGVPQPDPAPSAPDTRPGRFGCAWMLLADGLLVVASLATPDAPGLSSAEQDLLLRLSAALAPGRALPTPVEYHWPPRGVRVPGLARAAEAEKSLREQLATWRADGVRDLLLLGDAMDALLSPLVSECGIRVVLAPAPGAMLADPQAKRACWDVAKPLVRAAS